jgi:DNA modification methylase
MPVRILRGDCLDVLRSLPADSVHCCVTSPPYYGLRDYGVAGQIGLEATPDAYIAQMVEVFRLVRRVLRDDGTVWLNLGDSYASGTGYKTSSPQQSRNGRGVCGPRNLHASAARANARGFMDYGEAKPKDLLMMPARVALALQADGWWLRSDIIWHKPNPMPESVTDRPTSAHEHVFLLAKQPRYFFDADGIREKVGEETRRTTEFRGETSPYKDHQSYTNTSATKTHAPRGDPSLAGRNARSVWTIATAPYSDAHFATFPPELAERCIKAGTSERGCCAACGAPWVRQVERKHYGDKSGGDRSLEKGFTRNAMGGQQEWDAYVAPVTTGWSPSCTCAAACVPAVVLDPFGGSGTVGLVADRLQRDAVLIELNPDYAAMAERRLHRDAGLFAEVATA